MFMRQTIYHILRLAGLSASVLMSIGHSQMTGSRIVRIAEIEIDPNQLETYKAALKEEIAFSIRLEPGVLTLYAVSLKDHPNQIRLFESYRSQSAYESHLRTAHFLAYKSATQTMVKSLRLIETEPILLGSKCSADDRMSESRQDIH